MRIKRIAAIILSLVLCAGVLSGCALFTHDNERDMRQIVAVVRPIEETRESGTVEEGNFKTDTFKTEKKDIYKYDLNISVRNSAQSVMQQYNYTAEQAVDYLLNQLVVRQLVLNEADIRIHFGEIEWGDGSEEDENGDRDYTEVNKVKKLVYNAIDNSVENIRKTLLGDRDEPVGDTSTGGGDSSSSSTTYPVPETEEPEETPDREPWEPEKTNYPGLYGTPEQMSQDREVMRRLISQIKKNAGNDFKATGADKKKFKKDAEEIDRVINEQGIEAVYPMLGDTHIMYWLVGRSAEEQIKLELLQKYVEDSVSVSSLEITERYNKLLETQQMNYGEDVNAYYKAMKDGTETVLYHPDNNYFYVKHILISFSQKQKDDYTAYKKTGAKEAELKTFREQQVGEIVAYPHVDGEDDKTRPMTVNQVFSEIKARMSPYRTSPMLAEREFDQLIFEFNTDPGIFNNEKGYGETVKLPDGESETYVKEFAAAAREMQKTLEIGQLYGDYVITEHGVHIMYLANKNMKGVKLLTDYVTPGEYTTYYDLIEEQMLNARKETSFDNWVNERVYYYTKSENKVVTTFKDAYRNLFE